MYLSPYIRFDGIREEREWFEGYRDEFDKKCFLHPALCVIVLAAAHWLYRKTGKPAVITHLYRTSKEQKIIYPDEQGKRSTHEFGRAADLRARDLDREMVGQWEAWINNAFSYLGRKGAQTALFHQVGDQGIFHLHIQVGPAEPSPAIPDTFIV